MSNHMGAVPQLWPGAWSYLPGVLGHPAACFSRWLQAGSNTAGVQAPCAVYSALRMCPACKLFVTQKPLKLLFCPFIVLRVHSGRPPPASMQATHKRYPHCFTLHCTTTGSVLLVIIPSLAYYWWHCPTHACSTCTADLAASTQGQVQQQGVLACFQPTWMHHCCCPSPVHRHVPACAHC
jgi:hypothetical protein